MRVIEQYTIGKSTTTPSEDAVVVTPYYAAVIDGATPKTEFRYPNGETPGHRAARLLANAVKQLPPDAEASSAIAMLNSTLHEENLEAANRPTASIVIFAALRREIWMVGDCLHAWVEEDEVCNSASHNCKELREIDNSASHICEEVLQMGSKTLHTCKNPKQIDNILSQWRGDIIRSLLSRGVCREEDIVRNDPGRNIIQPQITRQVRYQNMDAAHPLAFGVLDGETIPSRFIICHPIPEKAKQLILATDGYPTLLPTLDETETELKRLLENDPLCIGPLAGTKGVKPGNISYDDRTYLRLEL